MHESKLKYIFTEIVDHVSLKRFYAHEHCNSTVYIGNFTFEIYTHVQGVTSLYSRELPFRYRPELQLRFLAATKQLYEWFSPSVRPSVRLSVCLSVTPFWLCSHHRIIMKFSGVVTSDKSDVHAKSQGQRSKVKVTEVTTQLNRFRTVTPV